VAAPPEIVSFTPILRSTDFLSPRGRSRRSSRLSNKGLTTPP
jgi:hypothetical protein